MTNATNSKYTKNIEMKGNKEEQNENKNKAFFPNIS